LFPPPHRPSLMACLVTTRGKARGAPSAWQGEAAPATAASSPLGGDFKPPPLTVAKLPLALLPSPAAHRRRRHAHRGPVLLLPPPTVAVSPLGNVEIAPPLTGRAVRWWPFWPTAAHRRGAPPPALLASPPAHRRGGPAGRFCFRPPPTIAKAPLAVVGKPPPTVALVGGGLGFLIAKPPTVVTYHWPGYFCCRHPRRASIRLATLPVPRPPSRFGFAGDCCCFFQRHPPRVAKFATGGVIFGRRPVVNPGLL